MAEPDSKRYTRHLTHSHPDGEKSGESPPSTVTTLGQNLSPSSQEGNSPESKRYTRHLTHSPKITSKISSAKQSNEQKMNVELSPLVLSLQPGEMPQRAASKSPVKMVLPPPANNVLKVYEAPRDPEVESSHDFGANLSTRTTPSVPSVKREDEDTPTQETDAELKQLHFSPRRIPGSVVPSPVILNFPSRLQTDIQYRGLQRDVEQLIDSHLTEIQIRIEGHNRAAEKFKKRDKFIGYPVTLLSAFVSS